MKFIKRLLSVLVIMAMVMTLLPAAVSAEDEYTVTFTVNGVDVSQGLDLTVGEAVEVKATLKKNGTVTVMSDTGWSKEGSSLIYLDESEQSIEMATVTGRAAGSARLKLTAYIEVVQEGDHFNEKVGDFYLPINVAASPKKLELTVPGHDVSGGALSDFEVGEKAGVTAVLKENGAAVTEDYTVDWKVTSQDRVLTHGDLDANPLSITGKKEGSAVITAKAVKEVGGNTVTIDTKELNVTVIGSTYELSVSDLSSVTAYVGETTDLSTTLTRKGQEVSEDDYSVTWKMDKYDPEQTEKVTDYLTFDDNDKAAAVSGKKPKANIAKLTVTASIEDDNGSEIQVDKEELPVTVADSRYDLTLAVEGHDLSEAGALTDFTLGETADVTAVLQDQEGEEVDTFDLDWQVTDTTGVLDFNDRTSPASMTGKAKGTATVTATASLDGIVVATKAMPVTVIDSAYVLELSAEDQTSPLTALTAWTGEQTDVATTLKDNSGAEVDDYYVVWALEKYGSSDYKVDDYAACDYVTGSTTATVTGKQAKENAANLVATAYIEIGGNDVAVKSCTIPVTVAESRYTLELTVPGHTLSDQGALTDLHLAETAAATATLKDKDGESVGTFDATWTVADTGRILDWENNANVLTVTATKKGSAEVAVSATVTAGSYEVTVASKTMPVTVVDSSYELALSAEGQTSPLTALTAWPGEQVEVTTALTDSGSEADDYYVEWALSKYDESEYKVDDYLDCDYTTGSTKSTITGLKEKENAAKLTATAYVEAAGVDIAVASVTIPVSVAASRYELALTVPDHTLVDGRLDLQVAETANITTALTVNGESVENYSVTWDSVDPDSILDFNDRATPVSLTGLKTGTATVTAAATVEVGSFDVDVAMKALPVKVDSSYQLAFYEGTPDDSSEPVTSVQSYVGEPFELTTVLKSGTGEKLDNYYIEWELDKYDESAYEVDDYVACDSGDKPKKAVITGKKAKANAAKLKATAYVVVGTDEFEVKSEILPVTVISSRYKLNLTAAGYEDISEGLTLGVPDQVVLTAGLTDKDDEPVTGYDIEWSVSEGGSEIISFDENGNTAAIACKKAGSAGITATATIRVNSYDIEVGTVPLDVTVVDTEYALKLFDGDTEITDGLEIEPGDKVVVQAYLYKDGERVTTLPEGWRLEWTANSDDGIIFNDAGSSATIIGEDDEAQPAFIQATVYFDYADGSELDPPVPSSVMQVDVTPSSKQLVYKVDGTTAGESLALEVGEQVVIGASLVDKDGNPVTAGIALNVENSSGAIDYDDESETSISVTGEQDGESTVTATATLKVDNTYDIEVGTKDLPITVTYPTIAVGQESKEFTGNREFIFTPSADGNYVFTSSHSDDQSAQPAADPVDGELERNNNYDSKNDFRVVFEAHKGTPVHLIVKDNTGKKYKVKMENGPQYFDPYDETWATTGHAALNVGDTKDVNASDLFTFKPDKTQKYTFYAMGGGTPKVRVIDSSGTVVGPAGTAEDVRDSSKYPSETEFAATAGQTYYLQTTDSAGTASFKAGLLNGSEETKKAAQDKINEANKISSSAYTASSYAAVTKARQALQNLLKDPSATTQQIQAGTDALTKAISGLKKKAANPVKVKFKNKTYKRKTVRKKKRSYKAVTVSQAKGSVVYTAKGTNKKSRKALKFSKKTGKITVKKKTRKGTYKMTITVQAKGDGNYKASGVFKKTVKVRVK